VDHHPGVGVLVVEPGILLDGSHHDTLHLFNGSMLQNQAKGGVSPGLVLDVRVEPDQPRVPVKAERPEALRQHGRQIGRAHPELRVRIVNSHVQHK